MQRGCRWRPTRRSSWRTWRATSTWPLRTSSCGTPALRSTIVYSLSLHSTQCITVLLLQHSILPIESHLTAYCNTVYLVRSYAYRTPFGVCYEASVQTYLDSHKAERDNNLWALTLGVPGDAAFADCPAGSARVHQWASANCVLLALTFTRTDSAATATWLLYRSKCFLKVRTLISQLQSLSNLHILLTRILSISFKNFQALS